MREAFIIVSIILFILAGLSPLYNEPRAGGLGWIGLAFFAASFLAVR